MPLVIFIDDSETALASTSMATKGMLIEVKQYTEARAALREVPSTKSTPTLMLTTETKGELPQQGKALGLTGWIVKPFNSAQLKSAITRVLRLPA